MLPAFDPRPWGTQDLSPIYPNHKFGEKIGEAWLSGDHCKVANGPLAGQTLAQLSEQDQRDLVGEAARDSKRFPLLLKFLFPHEKLSVQVHPDDEQALRVGQPFPDLDGLSVTGAREHLASYRGKVVVFDVWATWCGPCKAMIPHEREMVEKLKGQPFALISVSADDEKGDLEKFLAKTPMPWVHWWGKADDGKLLKALNIRFYPTIYVLDANGVIRYKNVRGEELTKAVEVCLAEMKGKEKVK